jgi:hypothetical protein
VAKDNVAVGIDLAAGLQVEEGTAVEIRLLKVEVELLSLVSEAGLKLAKTSLFKPAVKVSFNSTLVERRLAVFQDCVTLIPLLSPFLASREDVIGPSWWAAEPFAVKLTPLGAFSLTSSAAAALW